jgi:hydrophobic/amphiphilic exporter-1 (mainly G- bacteria), HAE1 family
LRWRWLHYLIDKFEEGHVYLNGLYRSVLGWALNHRITVVLISLILLVMSLALLPMGFIGAEFMRETDRGEFSVQMEMPIGTALNITNDAVNIMEENLSKMPEVKNYIANVGVSQSEWSSTERPNLAQINVTLIEKQLRKKSTSDVINMLSIDAAKIPGLKVSMSPISMFGAAQESPLQLEVKGTDLDVLAKIADQVVAIVGQIDGTRDVKSNWEEGQPEIKISVDRDRAAQMGLSLGEIGMALRNALEGDVPTKYKDGVSEYDTRVVLAKMNRTRPEDVGKVALMNYRGERVFLSQVADVYYGKGPTTISRKDRQRLITVVSNLTGSKSIGDIQKELQKRIADLDLPPDVKIEYSGDFQMMADMFSDMITVIGFAALFIYMIMVALFESYVHPFTIMFSIPVALVGALSALALTGGTLNMFSMIGILLSLGLVTKNAILLVDRTNDQRSKGLTLREALLEAGPTRLRPILMTTLTMVFGMMPMAIAFGSGSEIRQSMAIAVIGALLSSTLLTLVLIPVIYSYLEGGRERLRNRKLAKSPWVNELATENE